MTADPSLETVRIGIVSISDRASQGVYEDKGLPALRDWLGRALYNPIEYDARLIPDEQALISQTLIDLVDAGCHLVLTTGGTGPSKRDVTPEATLAVAHKELPGFGEQMRQVSLKFVPTAILSRQVAVIREESLIINLPGQPKSIAETLGGVRDQDGRVIVNGIFSAIPYGVELIGGPIITTHDAFGYFEKAYGLTMVAPLGIGSEAQPAAKDLARIIRQIRSEAIPAIFLEMAIDPRLAEQLAAETGVKIGGTLYADTLSQKNGPAGTYITMMETNIRTLTNALAP